MNENFSFPFNSSFTSYEEVLSAASSDTAAAGRSRNGLLVWLRPTLPPCLAGESEMSNHVSK